MGVSYYAFFKGWVYSAPAVLGRSCTVLGPACCWIWAPRNGTVHTCARFPTAAFPTGVGANLCSCRVFPVGAGHQRTAESLEPTISVLEVTFSGYLVPICPLSRHSANHAQAPHNLPTFYTNVRLCMLISTFAVRSPLPCLLFKTLSVDSRVFSRFLLAATQDCIAGL